MKQTALSVNKAISLSAALAALAIVLSYLEAVSGINSLMPVPGTKLGLANIAVTVTAYTVSLRAGAAVSFLRVCVMSLLFGSPTTFLFSLCGALLAYAFTVFAKLAIGGRISLIGVSVGAAAMHMTGQLIAACIMLTDISVLRLLPLYLVTAVITGIFTGALSEFCVRRLKRVHF
ncbi:MAG: Gx transporter family protein [Clostridia bacterium]|nr:Gx transporter family protein [Clostridia bacterium]